MLIPFSNPYLTGESWRNSDDQRHHIIDQVRDEGYFIFKQYIETPRVITAVQKLKNNFSPVHDNPPTGEGPQAVQTNFQKLNIGGASTRYNNYARFFRTIYNPVWADDLYGMRAIFLEMITLRNWIMGLSEGYASLKIESSGLWSAARIHHYPTGGGFFSPHRDTTLIDVAEASQTPFFQLLLVMTKKGSDFKQGGAFIEKNSTRRMIEDEVQLGDLILYDGNSVHGVEEIDPHKRLDLNTLNGRLAAFVSLYKTI